jgi:hypothetical protein
MVTRRQWVFDESDYVNFIYFIPTMVTRCVYTTLWHDIKNKFWEYLIASFSLIRHGPYRKLKNKKVRGTQTYRQQGNVTSLLTKIRGDTQQGDLLSLLTLKIIKGINRQMDRYRRITHPQRGDLISLLLLLAYFPYF